MLIYPKYIGTSPTYHIGSPILANHIPLIIDKIDKIYTKNDGNFNLAKRYASGPINIVDKTTKDATNARLAISYPYHHYHYHNFVPSYLLLVANLR